MKPVEHDIHAQIEAIYSEIREFLAHKDTALARPASQDGRVASTYQKTVALHLSVGWSL